MIISDLHTHTRYSHGSGSVGGNLAEAERAGIKQLGISDHAFNNMNCAISEKGFSALKKEIAFYREKTEIELLFGVESNICALDGSLDLRSHAAEFDYIITGYHKAIYGSERRYFGLSGLLANSLFKPTETVIKNYTRGMINAIKKNKIDIISHPKYAAPVDIFEIGRAAVDYGVYLELNGKRVNMSDEEILRLLDMGVTFILGSDAHSPKRVGNFDLPMKYVEKLKIPPERIANYDKTVVFPRRK